MKKFILFSFFFHLLVMTSQVDTVRMNQLIREQTRIKTITDSLTKQVDSLQKEISKIARQHPDSQKVWHRGGLINLNATQVSLTNWVGGGQNNISLGSIVNLFANYKKGETSWENVLLLQYGIIKQGENKNWWKNDDQIQFTSNFGKNAFDTWYYSMLFDFQSQFTAGYSYPNDTVVISDFLAPGYGILAAGLDWKAMKNFTFLMAPVTGKFTVVNNTRLANAGAFGVQPATYDSIGNIINPGKKLRTEIGGYIKLQFKREFNKNITFENNIELFSNYLKKPENVDVVWTTLTSFKLNKLLTATLNTHLIYDDDVRIPVDRDGDGNKESSGPRVQFKQLFGLGFSYKL
jgi:hypothetical protein